MKDEIRRLADENVYMVDYLLGQARDKSDESSSTTQALLEWSGTEDVEVKALPSSGTKGLSFNDITRDAAAESEEEWIGLE
jgi:periodic tryptophan protein 2